MDQVQVKGPKQRSRRFNATLRSQEQLRAFSFLLPTLIIVLGISLGPLLFAGWLSLNQVSPLLRKAPVFIGLENYIHIFQASSFRDALVNTIYFVVVSLVIQIILGLLVALLLNQKFVGRNFVRALILIPWAIPTVVNGALWQWIYDTSYGALNGILIEFHIITAPIAWLGTSPRAMNMAILADTWKVLPFYVIMFLAGLQTIPEELYDAVAVDGGNAWAKFRHVILPFLRPFILIILVLRTMETFRVFDIIYMLTKGGPGGSTSVIAYYAYLTTFPGLDLGGGAAMSFMIGAIILALAIVYFRLLQSEDIR